MSPAMTMFKRLTAKRRNGKELSAMLDHLCSCTDSSPSITIDGEEFEGKQVKEFVKEFKGLLKAQWNSDGNSIEDMFWLEYAADMVQLRLPAAKTRDQKLAKFMYKMQEMTATVVGDNDVGPFISAIRLM